MPNKVSGMTRADFDEASTFSVADCACVTPKKKAPQFKSTIEV